MKARFDLLLEIGCEEIPSRFMAGALEQLKEETALLLEENRLPHGGVKTWGTPRRLVVRVSGLADRQDDRTETVKGPPVNRSYDQEGRPTGALLGFMRGQGVEAAQLSTETIKGAPYIVVHREVAGLPTLELLPRLLPRILQKLSFPRPMFWHNREIRFARPVRWLLALYGDRPVSFNWADLQSGRVTYGHRFLAPGPHRVAGADHYFQCLEENYVIVDQDRRRAIVQEQLAEKTTAKGGQALIDPALLEEVVHLVEYPVAIEAYFDEAYLDLPGEVLITTMQQHQRYFPVAREDGEGLLPYFIGISNNLEHPNIRKGYSKVLQARLADARFFFNEDREKPLESYVGQLSGVIFLESLGSLEDKRLRLVELTGLLGRRLALPGESLEIARRAAHLCKADLVTGMVREFTSLQGVMGREYARLSGEPAPVAAAIHEHYLPRFSGDAAPATMAGGLVSLADRIDTLAGCFALGMQPTGSQDPYGLRRLAQGAVTVMEFLEIDLSLQDYIDDALTVLAGSLSFDDKQREEILENLLDFFKQRIRYSLQEKGLAHDVIEAVLGVPLKGIPGLLRRAEVLQQCRDEAVMANTITAYNRVANLAGRAPGGEIRKDLLKETAEVELNEALQAVAAGTAGCSDPLLCLEKLAGLREPVDRFFDNVMVMVDEEALRENRLNLLSALLAVFHRLADFSAIQAS